MMPKTKGFTILEVLITVVIITVALLALSQLQTAAVGTNYTSHRLTIATILAQDKLEELQALSYDDPQLSETNPDNFVGGVFDWTLAVDHTNVDGPDAVPNPINESGAALDVGHGTLGYYREWNVAEDAPAPKMKTIAVRVRWSQQRGKSVIFNTIISD